MSSTTPTSLPTHALPSYLQADHLGPWGIYLQQVDRVTPYLGGLARWTTAPSPTSRATACSTTPAAAQARAACASTRT
jgi:glutamate dehydrogenase (NAD(P)+)